MKRIVEFAGRLRSALVRGATPLLVVVFRAAAVVWATIPDADGVIHG